MNLLFKTCVNLFALSALMVCSHANAQDKAAALKASEAWLEKNRLEPDVVQTKSGLQYKVLRSAQGCYPHPREPVTMHYEASLAADGRVVDSSYQRGAPASFSLRKMIRGWKEGIPMMREGEMWQFFVPPNLAYGSKGSPPYVGPNVVMIFRVELIKV
ncbi:MAG TPA: FKBP-type peptidyl-prolyl cis-trans isomerase, partial [Steroidobacteraceae bacterium]|nr:FKBP-type peptidyl-prolyl cis-trans isomerase [Steroidobacteraceae bacterium]